MTTLPRHLHRIDADTGHLATPYRVLSVAAVFLLGAAALVGCAAEDRATLPNSSDETASSTAAAGAEQDQSPTPAAVAEETVAPVEPDRSSPTECILGKWTADPESFIAQSQGPAGALKYISGKTVVEFAPDLSMTTNYDGWTLDYLVDGTSSIINRTGIDAGTYTLGEDGTISMKDSTVGSTMTVSVQGTTMNVAPEAQNMVGAPFTCDEKEITILANEVVSKLTRSN